MGFLYLMVYVGFNGKLNGLFGTLLMLGDLRVKCYQRPKINNTTSFSNGFSMVHYNKRMVYNKNHLNV